MKHYPYLIIGGGMTAHAAALGIRELDANSTIGLFTTESHPPYSRPPLSKGLWKGKPLEKIWLKSLDEKIDVHLGKRIMIIDTVNKQVQSEQGDLYRYDMLLLATGGVVRRLPYGGEKILYYRTLNDYQQLKSCTGQGKRFMVIGGGFIGSEIAAALAMNGEKVTMVFPDNGIGHRIFPKDLSTFINDYYRQKGVEVLSSTLLTGIEEKNGWLIAITSIGDLIQVDHIVVGIGITPNTDLAQKVGLKVDNGVVVDEYLHTSEPNIFAAGDVASFFNPILGVRMRVEHEDNALIMGKHAGLNMALQAASQQLVPYHHLPFFYSDLFELGYEAVGELDSRFETYSDWQEHFKKGVVYYLKEKRIRGVLLWNVWDQVETARRLIAETGSIEVKELKDRKLFR